MADPAHVQIASNGAENYRSWKSARPDAVLDLSGAVIHELILPNSDLRGANLSGATIDRIDVTGSHLEEANLSGLKCQPQISAPSSFKKAHLERADLSNSIIPKASFDDAFLSDANCTNADFQACSFLETTMDRVRLDCAKLNASAFNQATMEGATLKGACVSGCHFGFANLQRADLTECIGSPDRESNQAGVQFDSSNLSGAILERADFECASFNSTELKGANLQRCKLRVAHLVAADFREASLREAILEHATINNANLDSADLTGASCGSATFEDARFQFTKLRDADCHRASFNKAKLSGCDVYGTDFWEAEVHSSEWSGVVNLPHAKRVELTKTSAGALPLYVESISLTWFQQWCSWEVISRFGRLPLFGASWAVLLLIPTYLYVLAWHNSQVDNVKARFEANHLAGKSPAIAEFVQSLHHLPMPSWPLITLGSTTLLAVAATLYSFFCPARVNEFTRNRWCDEFGKSLLHYLPLTWHWPYVRFVCGSFYVVGGIGAAAVIIRKLILTTAYIVEHS